MKRKSIKIHRKTTETDIEIVLKLYGGGNVTSDTKIPFLDHMIRLFGKFSFIDIDLSAKGDIDVDAHHLNEDVAIVLGRAISNALGTRKNIKRFGDAIVPMDESLVGVRVVIDISGRPGFYCSIAKGIKDVPIKTGKGINYSLQDAKHFFRSLSYTSLVTMHIDVLKGEDQHHIIESIFKAAGKAFAEAVSIEKRAGVPSTKGKIEMI
jgi:imidazoleglycerol-phosphate dehydratase